MEDRACAFALRSGGPLPPRLLRSGSSSLYRGLGSRLVFVTVDTLRLCA